MSAVPLEPTPVLLVPSGKLRCYIHPDVLRKDTPEEHVRQRIARSLVEEYGYSKADLHLEFPIKIGSGRSKRVDIAIFPRGVEHRQQTIQIIVEAKREDVRPNDQAEGVKQLWSYMSACMNVRWGLWVGTEMQAFEKEIDPERAARDPFPPPLIFRFTARKSPGALNSPSWCRRQSVCARSSSGVTITCTQMATSARRRRSLNFSS